MEKECTHPPPVGQFQKVLSELNTSRINTENNRRVYQKARSDIQDLNQNVSKLREQGDVLSKKLSVIQEKTAERVSEVNFFQKKFEVVNNSCQALGKSISIQWDALRKLMKESMEISSSILERSSCFSKVWNCSDLGISHRALLQKNSKKELEVQKSHLNSVLGDFMSKKRIVDNMEVEGRELEVHFEEHEMEVVKREKELRSQIQQADVTLSDLHMKRDFLLPKRSDELNRIGSEIRRIRETSSNLEKKVAQTQRNLKNQRHKRALLDVDYQFDSKKSRVYQPVKPTVKSSPFTCRILDRSATEINNLEIEDSIAEKLNPKVGNIPADNSKLELSSSFSETRKVPRMFRFKKKSVENTVSGFSSLSVTAEQHNSENQTNPNPRELWQNSLFTFDDSQ